MAAVDEEGTEGESSCYPPSFYEGVPLFKRTRSDYLPQTVAMRDVTEIVLRSKYHKRGRKGRRENTEDEDEDGEERGRRKKNPSHNAEDLARYSLIGPKFYISHQPCLAKRPALLNMH